MEIILCDELVDLAKAIVSHKKNQSTDTTHGKKIEVFLPEGSSFIIGAASRIYDGVKAKNLYCSLRFLAKCGFLRVLYASKTKIVISLTRRGLSFFNEIAESHFRKIGVFTDLQLIILALLTLMPSALNVESLSQLLNISPRGVRKIISKFMRYGILVNRSIPNNIGYTILKNLLPRDYCKQKIQNIFYSTFWLLGIYDLVCTHQATDTYEIIDVLLNILKSALSLESNKALIKNRRLAIITVTKEPKVIEASHMLISKLQNTINTFIIPFLYPEDYFFEKIFKVANNAIHRMFSDTCTMGVISDESGLYNMFTNDLKTITNHIVKNILGERTLILFIAPYVLGPAIFHILGYILLKQGVDIRNFFQKHPPTLIHIPRISNAVLYLKNDLNRIFDDGNRAYRALLNAIRNNERIIFEWNIDTEYPSKVEITFKKHKDYNIKRLFVAADVCDFRRKTTLQLPPGEVRITMFPSFHNIADIEGEIFLFGEPIVGLKPPKMEWLHTLDGKPECKIAIKTLPTGVYLKIMNDKDGFTKHFINNSRLLSIGFGFNKFITNTIENIFDPIIMKRTQHFLHIHFCVASPFNNSKLPAYVLLKNAIINTQSNEIWRSIDLQNRIDVAISELLG